MMLNTKEMLSVNQLAGKYHVTQRTFLAWLRHILQSKPELESKIKFYREIYYGTNGCKYRFQWKTGRKNISPAEIRTIADQIGSPEGRKITLNSLSIEFGISRKTLMTVIKPELPDDFFFNNIPASCKIDNSESELPLKSNKKRRIRRIKQRNFSKIHCLTPKQAKMIREIYLGDPDTGSQM